MVIHLYDTIDSILMEIIPLDRYYGFGLIVFIEITQAEW